MRNHRILHFEYQSSKSMEYTTHQDTGTMHEARNYSYNSHDFEYSFIIDK